LGQRPETILNIKVGSCHLLRDEHDDPMLEVAIGNMTNLPARMSTSSVPLHKQQIFKHPNFRLCAVDAHERQRKLLGPSTAEDYLFRGIKTSTKADTLTDSKATYATCHNNVATFPTILISQRLVFSAADMPFCHVCYPSD
jgi:hypothetical protein